MIIDLHLKSCTVDQNVKTTFQEVLNEISVLTFLGAGYRKIWRLHPTTLQSEITLRVNDYWWKEAQKGLVRQLKGNISSS